MSIKKFFKSLGYALKGIKYGLVEQNFRIQIYIAAVVVIFMVYFQVKPWEIVALVLVIIFVLILELLNTIFEHLADILKPRLHHYVEIIKDVMAAAVLLASLAAVVVGLIIFWPYVFK